MEPPPYRRPRAAWLERGAPRTPVRGDARDERRALSTPDRRSSPVERRLLVRDVSSSSVSLGPRHDRYCLSLSAKKLRTPTADRQGPERSGKDRFPFSCERNAALLLPGEAEAGRCFGVVEHALVLV